MTELRDTRLEKKIFVAGVHRFRVNPSRLNHLSLTLRIEFELSL
ncbi:hypothetical protein D1BOALGB6SA_8882 [Olavius sp. associated proteobacterium Delta 1]|nr:hypothetical protein D1BOALGB6SA_8882 [Olavius sp. associated proteobacterium Delta 1]